MSTNNSTKVESSKFLQKKETIDKVTFETDVSINLKGIIEVTTKIKNRSPFGRYKVTTMIRFMNSGNIIQIVETDDIYLDGTFVSAFSKKKNSAVKTLYAVLSFENVIMDDPNKVSGALKSIDAEISKIASDLRRTKILGGSEVPEVITLTEKLQNLKQNRMDKYKELEWIEKLNAINIDIQHSAV